MKVFDTRAMKWLAAEADSAMIAAMMKTIEQDSCNEANDLVDVLLLKALKGRTYRFADRMLEPGMRDEEGREEKFKGKWWEKEI